MQPENTRMRSRERKNNLEEETKAGASNTLQSSYGLPNVDVIIYITQKRNNT